MNNLDIKLNKTKLTGRIKLMTHVVIGYPNLEKTIEIVKAMVATGADMIELQIPFSDPLADGPTIMRACEKALENGTSVKDAFRVMREIVRHSGQARLAGALAKRARMTKLYFMCYYNTVFRFGVEQFCKEAKDAGATGLIVPDMPIEEDAYEHLFVHMKKYGLENIRVVSPSSTDVRLRLNAKYGNGFVYATARQGITGARSGLDKRLEEFLGRVRKYFRIPLAVGFGISKSEHMSALVHQADIAVVGSAIIDVINKSSEDTMISHVKKFIEELRM